MQEDRDSDTAHPSASSTSRHGDPGTAQTSRMDHSYAIVSRGDVIKDILKGKGFSPAVIPYIYHPQRESSGAVYDLHWEKFCKFCKKNNWNPKETTPPRMCEFLLDIFLEGKAVNSIENTHSGVLSVLKHCADYPSRAPVVSDLLTTMWRLRPRNKKTCTEWDVNHVLDSFLKSPYVDDNGEDTDIDLKHLTVKTAFLIALACSRRRSELHAFSRASSLLRIERNTASGETIISIRTVPGFMAKMQRGKELYPAAIFNSVSHLTDDKHDKLLCPTATLVKYLDRTKDFENPTLKLFVNFTKNTKATAASLACWLKAAITQAYKQSESSKHCNPHEIRAVASSLSLMNHASVSDILEAGTWRAFTTFTTHYFRDVARGEDQLYRLPAYVAAGTVIH